jgi:hypothetical protein
MMNAKGERHGHGAMLYKRKGERDGKNTYDMYVGAWFEGEAHGKGERTYANGER